MTTNRHLEPWSGGLDPFAEIVYALERTLEPISSDAGDAGSPAVQLSPRNLGAEHVEGAEVLELLVAGRLAFGLHDAEHEPCQVRLQPGVRRADSDSQLLEHLVAVGGSDHRRKPWVFQRLADLRGVVGQGRSDRHAESGEDAVDCVVEVSRCVAQRACIGRLDHARRHTRIAAGQRGDEDHRVGGPLQPRLLPALQQVVEADD